MTATGCPKSVRGEKLRPRSRGMPTVSKYAAVTEKMSASTPLAPVAPGSRKPSLFWAKLSGRMLAVSSLLSAILVRLKDAAAAAGWRDELRARLHRRGQIVRVDPIGAGRTLQGIVRDIDDRGRLVLELSDGRRETVTQGELPTAP